MRINCDNEERRKSREAEGGKHEEEFRRLMEEELEIEKKLEIQKKSYEMRGEIVRKGRCKNVKLLITIFEGKHIRGLGPKYKCFKISYLEFLF